MPLENTPTKVDVLPPAAYLPPRTVALELPEGGYYVAPTEYQYHTYFENDLRELLPDHRPVPFHMHWWVEEEWNEDATARVRVWKSHSYS